MRTRWTEALSCAALAALVFSNTLPAGFVYDDNRAIVQNEDARWGSSVESLLIHDFWGTSLHSESSHGSWRPLTTLTFRLDHLLAGGLHAHVYHVTNVALHALVTALLVLWARSLLPRGVAPRVAGLMFAVYPVHCEAVAGLVGRAELAQAACTLLALLAYRKYTGPLRMLLALTFAIAATLFKEQGLVTLALCGASDVLHHSSPHELLELLISSKLTSRLRRLRSRLRTLTLASAVLVCARIAVAGGTLPRFVVADNPAAHEPSLLTRSLTFLYLPAFSAKLCLFPHILSFDWSMDAVPLVRSMSDPRLLTLALLYLTLAGVAWRCDKAASQALLLTVLPFLPVSNLVGYVGFVAAERVLYSPSLGLCLLLGLGFARLWDTQRLRSCLVLALGLLITVFAVRTLRRNLDWHSEETLYRSGLAVNPPKAYGNLGSILAAQGRSREAEDCYRIALKHRPNMADVHYNLGLLLLQVGGSSRLHEAEMSLHAAISCRPKLAAAHVALGVTLARRGAVLEAETALAHAATLDVAGQRDPRAHQAARASALLHLGRLQLERQRTHDALDTLLRARDAMPPGYHQPQSCLENFIIILFPSFSVQYYPERLRQYHHCVVQSVYNLLGEAYSRLGRPEQAEPWVRASLAANPDHFLLRRGRHAHAAQVLERVFAVSAETRYQDLVNTATAHRLAGQLDVAERFYLRARDLHPQNILYDCMNENISLLIFFSSILSSYQQEASSHGNLGACQHLAGRLHEAEQSYQRALALQPGDPVTRGNLQRLRRLLSGE
ncbi:hypothetical protein B566_EDAN014578 [Ephemera danica]|nr:hypothetical protein B566_EDAN014578 [Ephemera danica]